MNMKSNVAAGAASSSHDAAAASPVGFRRLQSAFYAVGLGVLLAVALYWGRVVIVPLALSVLFAFILSSPADWLEKRGLGRVAGVLIVVLGAFGLVAAVVTVASMQVHGLAADLPKYEANINRKMGPVHAMMARVEKLQSNIRDVAPATSQPTASESGDAPAPVVVKPQEASALGWLPTLVRPLVELLVNGLLVAVLTVFMLMQRESFRDRLIRLAGRSRLSGTTRALADAADRVGKYLLLQLMVNALLGGVVTLGLYLFRVPYAPLFGLLVTVLRFVPYVGYWVAALAAVAICAAVAPGWTRPMMVLVMFLALDLTLANVIEPLVFSHGTGVSPVALLIAAVFWGFLWGPVGLLLSTPLTVCLAVLGKHVPSLGFLAIVLGDEPSLDPAARFYNRLLARDYDEAAVMIDTYAAEHPPEATYDEMILPALAQAKTDREQRDVSVEEERAVYDATSALLDGFITDGHAVAEKDGAAKDGKKPAVETETKAPAEAGAAVRDLPPVRVVGCAVFGEADAIALRMLGNAIAPSGGELTVASPETLVEELAKAGATSDKPQVVCLSTLSPGGLAQARGVIGQVKRARPNVKVLVGRWGQTGDTEQTERYLRASGADGIGWTLRETIGQLFPGRAGPDGEGGRASDEAGGERGGAESDSATAASRA